MDKFIYTYINKLSSNICNDYLHPNHITVLTIFPMILGYKFILEKNKIGFLSMVLLRWFLDNFDGSYARTCNKTSSFGSLLDTFMDIAYAIMIVYFVIQYYLPTVEYRLIISIISVLFFGCCKYWFFDVDANTHKSENKLYMYVYDNLIFISLLHWWIISRKF